MCKAGALTWGQVMEMMKDADPNLPVQVALQQGEGYLFRSVQSVYVSEELAEGGSVVFTDELPFIEAETPE